MRRGQTEKPVPLSTQRLQIPNAPDVPPDFAFAGRVGGVLHVSPVAGGRHQAG